jgi:rod shape-determining protein MreD
VIRRVLAVAAVVVTALLLQSTIFHDLRLLGVRPELLYLVTIVVAFLEGPGEGAVVGFVSGFAQDLLLNEPKGILALTLTLLGYSIGMLRQYIVSPSPFLPVILVALGTVGGVLFYVIVSFLLGNFDHSIGFAVRVALLSGLYNAILTPIVFPLLRRVFEGSRPQRVVRF